MFAQQCAACHGTFGEGEGRYPKLAGEGKLTGDRPEVVVGNYWPYATTVFDYIDGAMPFPAPHSLSADDVYAITAYVLNLNNLVPNDFVADKDSLPKVRMPNRDGFIWTDPQAGHARYGMHDELPQSGRRQGRLDRAGQGPDAAHHRAARYDGAEMTRTRAGA